MRNIQELSKVHLYENALLSFCHIQPPTNNFPLKLFEKYSFIISSSGVLPSINDYVSYLNSNIIVFFHKIPIFHASCHFIFLISRSVSIFHIPHKLSISPQNKSRWYDGYSHSSILSSVIKSKSSSISICKYSSKLSAIITNSSGSWR